MARPVLLDELGLQVLRFVERGDPEIQVSEVWVQGGRGVQMEPDNVWGLGSMTSKPDG